MKKTYIKPTSTTIGVKSVDALLMGASQGHTTNDNYTRRRSQRWDEDEWDEEEWEDEESCQPASLWDFDTSILPY